MTRYPRKFPRHRRAFLRTRRVVPNSGFYRPDDAHLTQMLGWINKVSRECIRSMVNVSSHLNTVEDFYAKGVQALSYVLHKYGGFSSKEEFERLARSSIGNRVKDHKRDIFRKKRWGFIVPLSEESQDSAPSTIASENGDGAMSDSLIPLYTLPESTLELDELILAFKGRISPGAYKLLKGIVEGDHIPNSRRKKDFNLFLELQNAAKELFEEGEHDLGSLLSKLQPIG